MSQINDEKYASYKLFRSNLNRSHAQVCQGLTKAAAMVFIESEDEHIFLAGGACYFSKIILMVVIQFQSSRFLVYLSCADL